MMMLSMMMLYVNDDVINVNHSGVGLKHQQFILGQRKLSTYSFSFNKLLFSKGSVKRLQVEIRK